KQLAHREMYFTDFFSNWLYIVKKNDIRETTFQNYTKALRIIEELFSGVKLKDLNDILVQQKIDKYAETHSKKTTHELLLKIKTSLRDAYARGYISTDFLYLRS
ncbi:phage integrase SAM-like domain-containing protein, partial [Streptococcus suis]|uniref:phage integrase SAM-like domain-containing protein n=1 Tax=Streptococcus suis TaxID=1307 RepID=UPI0039BDC71D